MTLQSLAGFDPNYKPSSVDNMIGSNVYLAQTDEEIGIVEDILLDEARYFRYLVIDTGSWLSNKKILLPVGRCRAYEGTSSIALLGIADKRELESLPPYESDRAVDYDYEEEVRGVYRQPSAAKSDRDTYSYDKEPELYEVSAEHSQNLKLYEERLIANKQRYQTGEVVVGKRIETETATAEVPIEKEKVIVERKTVTDEGIPVAPEEAKFEENAVAKVDVYEETADIGKQAFVREEVAIKKEVEREVVDASETIRKEELEMRQEGNPEIDK